MKVISETKARKQFGAKRLRKLWEDGNDPDIAAADWRESISEVLQEVDAQVAKHGLELVMHDTGDDNYVWHLEPLEMPTHFYQPEHDAEAWEDKMFHARMVFRDKKKAQEKFPDLKIVVLHPTQVINPIFVDEYKFIGD